MAYKIIWSPEAAETFHSIVTYLNTAFTDKEVGTFIKLVNRRLLLLSEFPSVGRLTSRTSKRKRIVIHKRTIIYYRVRERKRVVEILSFFDTRQHPGKRSS